MLGISLSFWGYIGEQRCRREEANLLLSSPFWEQRLNSELSCHLSAPWATFRERRDFQVVTGIPLVSPYGSPKECH